jgi:hypothetical protein
MFEVGRKRIQQELSPTGASPTRGGRQDTTSVAGELLGRMLQQIISVTGRLAYLASLRDPATNQYRHLVFERLVGPQSTDSTLRAAHRAVFYQWLSLSLVQHRGDLVWYLGHESSADDDLLRELRDKCCLEGLPPEDVAPHERQLFLSDLQLLFRSLLFDIEQ